MSIRAPSHSWFRRSFNEDYRVIYAGRDAAQAETEVDMIVRELGISRGEPVLDLCCGFGRHLAAFERRGIPAVGVDLSLPLLRQVPGSGEPEGGRRIVCADMRRLPFGGGDRGFPFLVNLFTSFGYFDDDSENLRAAREMARVLRPGGRFAMDLLNAELTIRLLEPRTVREFGPCSLLEERRFDSTRRRIEKHITLSRKDTSRNKHYVESVRIFSVAEISELLHSAGLEVERVLGDFTGRPFGSDTPRMIVLGRNAG